MNYENFIKSKAHIKEKEGFDYLFMPDQLFDFQKDIVKKALLMGRCAVFADTGLGKTLIELVVAHNIVKKTGGKVLIFTPLAVAFQFLKEAEKFGIPNVEHFKEGTPTGDIVVCNYERIDKVSNFDFECVICDESSILKNFTGKTKTKVNALMKNKKYRFLFTATPSPNDYIELGSSSEALGYLGYMDMLGRFFRNTANTSKNMRCKEVNQGEKFYLKTHAEEFFWDWIRSWAITIKTPSDLGFSNEGYDLPELIEKTSIVKNLNTLVVNDQTTMFKKPANNFLEIKAEQRATVKERCDKAFELSKDHEYTVFWVNLNDEAKYLKEISGAKEIKGTMSIEQKEQLLLDFSEGKIKKLITKTKITAFGLNWQHCNHTVYFPTYSYEQYYQAIRRFYRFGQKRNVHVDLVISDGQKKIMSALIAKKEKAGKMFEKLVARTTKNFIENDFEIKEKTILPNFLTQQK